MRSQSRMVSGCTESTKRRVVTDAGLSQQITESHKKHSLIGAQQSGQTVSGSD
jgi:hypothetical protein